MGLRVGITGKLFALYLVFFAIFCATAVFFYANVNRIVAISGNIVSKNNKIASNSKKMIESLLSMQEYNEKYYLLKKDKYWNFYQSAKETFEENLDAIVNLGDSGAISLDRWQALDNSYHHFHEQARGPEGSEAKKNWIPQSFINKWIELISAARAENEKNTEMALRKIHQKGRSAARNGLFGFGAAIIFGLFGCIFLAKSIVRPLRRLIQGIRLFSKERMSETIQIRYKDELGELADAFNEMTKRLKHEESMRSDFISMLSHEIRTPLTSIRESVNMILEEVLGAVNDRQKKFLKIASAEIGRISDLLNHLMQVSRMEVKALEIDPRPVAAYELISKSIEHLKPRAQTKGISFNIKVPTDAPKVLCTPEQLHQVFLNILGNAIKFTDKGGEIGIYAVAEKKGKYLAFSVSDSGPGISQDEKTLIFNKYFRSKEVRGHMDGVGLGLSISRQIIVAHGGTIWVKSEIGKGSIFGFTLPLADSD